MDLLCGDGRPALVGHRGAPLVAPENTLASIAAAVELGVDAVELDVVRRGDGTLALAHSREALAADSVPTLDEALEFLAGEEVGIQLDTKGGGWEAALAEAVSRHGLLPRTFVSTPSVRSLLALAAAEPELRRALTYPEDRLGLTGRRAVRPAVAPGLAALRRALPLRLPRWLRRVGASAATLNSHVVSPAVVRRCHEAGVAVYVWTVDDAALAERLVAFGADGIITNDPRIFASLKR